MDDILVFAFAAVSIEDRYVLVLTRWSERDGARYSSPQLKAISEHPDKRCVTELPYCPVWARDASDVQEKWLGIKVLQPFELSLPMWPFKWEQPLDFKVSHLLRYSDPFKNYAWAWGKEITVADIREASLLHAFSPQVDMKRIQKRDWVYHAQRIAWLAYAGWEAPITVFSSGAGMFVTDGNHRLAAAAYREDDMIQIQMYTNLGLRLDSALKPNG